MAGRTAEVAIVGGGVVGCAIAFELTRRGLADVVVFERAHLAAGATAICPGGIRQQFEGEADCLFARRSMRFWEEINERLEPEHPFVFERSGYLFLADSKALLERFTANVARQRRLGIPSRVLSPEEIGVLLPALRLDGVAGGSFCAEDGFLEDCTGVTIALVRRAEEGGARVVYEEVRALEREGSGWRVEHSGGRLGCRHVVLANGVDAVPLAATAGVELPIVAERRRLAFTVPYESEVLPPLLVAPERGFAGKQLANGVFYLGWLGETGREGETVFLEHALGAGATLLPCLGELEVRHVLAGVYDSTPDHRPILGRSGVPGLWLAVGLSGHGFMLAPAIAEALAARLCGGSSDLPLASFSLGRFDRVTRPEGLKI